MIRPENKPLSAGDARLLLNASRLYEMAPAPLPGPVRKCGPSTTAASARHPAPLNSNLRSAVIGDDDREAVFDTTAFPYNTIVWIDSYDPDYQEWWYDSGVLISPYCVLTYGGAIYDYEWDTHFTDFIITPGQYQEYEGGPAWAPFGSVYDCQGVTNSAWESSGGYEYNYGVVLMPVSYTHLTLPTN